MIRLLGLLFVSACHDAPIDLDAGVFAERQVRVCTLVNKKAQLCVDKEQACGPYTVCFGGGSYHYTDCKDVDAGFQPECKTVTQCRIGSEWKDCP